MARRGGPTVLGWLVIAGGLAAGIYYYLQSHRPRHHATTPLDAAPAAPAPAPVPVTPATPVAVDAAPPPPYVLYKVTEALDDIASSPLEFVGKGNWSNYGEAIPQCLYRNQRVFVLFAYCSGKESVALGLIVISPTRGYLSIYAEGQAAISTLTRADYINFEVSAAPPFETVDLGMTFAELSAWDERRTNSYGPECSYETGLLCLSGGVAGDWGESAEAFITHPPPALYRLAKDMHARAVKDRRR